MSASGDIVAEERYIQYYVMKIKNGNNKKLFDAIASQCGNNRAYDCIVGICCFEGYGTIKNYDIAKELLLRAKDLGCTYAKGYMARLVIMGMSDVWIKDRARLFRDYYLLKMPDGKQLVEEYYVKAPKIVAQIDALPERDTIYYRIWNQYLQRCMEFIQTNELESCKNVYIDMVKELDALYLYKGCFYIKIALI